MTLREYIRKLESLPQDWMDLEVQSFNDEMNHWHDPCEPKRYTLKMGEFAGDAAWLTEDWVEDPNATSKDVIEV